MRYHLLGRSALRVSELCLGTMTFGEEWGWGASADESRRIFDAFVAAGGNFIDTANRYTEGTSERLVGEFVRSDRERFVIASKYTLFTRKGDPNAAGNHRKNLVQSLDATLTRMGLEYLDLYWIHAWDFTTRADEVMRALDDQVRAGKILHVGVSDTPAWIVSRAQAIAELRGWTPFTALQVEHSLIERTVERDLIPMARALELAVTPWSPLAGGTLTGKYLDAATATGRVQPTAERRNERNTEVARAVVDLAREIGRTPAQVALTWLRHRDYTSIPILGARTLAQLEDAVGCVDLVLTAEQRSRLDAASAITLGFPHDFLARPNVRDLVSGATWEETEHPAPRA
ncbi:MAG: aldo/keto reductase [Gemmatimonadaceae bacterium]|jgi:aryl-alcohol dehydrogenase-like predicted oxidoreductase|nr:aldo/keto reductase [Gemmatimonadaceae bacterium]